MRVPVSATGLLVFLVGACMGACAAKQRDFKPTTTSPDPTEAQTATSEASPDTKEVGSGDSGEGRTPTDEATSGLEATATFRSSPSAESSATGPNETSEGDPAGSSSTSTAAWSASASSTSTSSGSDVEPDTSASTLWEDLVLHLTMDDAEWSAGGNVRDGSPAANHGIINGSVSQTPEGKFDKAAVLDGSGWITVPDSDSLDASSALTMSAWVNFYAVGTGLSPGIISKRTGFDYDAAYALFLGAEDKMWVDIDHEADRFSSVATVEADRWYHVAVVYDGAAPIAERVSLYVNGTLDSVAAETSSEIPAYPSDLEVGRLVNGGDTMTGMIDEVAVWRRALSAEEISELSRYPLR